MKRCYALSGIYDMRDSMDGMYDDNFYFNNPVDYMANVNDPWFLHQYGSCDIHLVTGSGPWENSGPTYACPGRSRAGALLITWTTGVRRADTNGPTGITRCGSTWARTSKTVALAGVGSPGCDRTFPKCGLGTKKVIA